MEYKIGDTVDVKTVDTTFVGIVLPSEKKNTLFLKLSSGYNVGIDKNNITELKIVKESTPPKQQTPPPVKQNTTLPTLSILHTGGTIASSVDYRTGAVSAQTTPEQIIAQVPELSQIANIDAKIIFQMFSEDYEPIHWQKLAEAISKEKNPVIVGIGTDTMEYASSALSFALKGIQIPVVLVGSQRSSDRPSSDASMNLLCAAQYATKSKSKGVFVCMHKSENDDDCYVIEGHHVKKMHTSRRDAFRPINKKPIAEVDIEGNIKEIRKPDSFDAFEFKPKFSNKVALVKIHPGFKAEQLDWYEKNCDGVVIEGYAFGQMPTNNLDEHTKHHPALLENMRKMSKKMPVVVVSQRPYGLVNMNVYSTTRDILETGVIEGKMQSHVALAKLSWVLGQTSDVNKAKKLMQTNISGEIVERLENETFLM